MFLINVIGLGSSHLLVCERTNITIPDSIPDSALEVMGHGTLRVPAGRRLGWAPSEVAFDPSDLNPQGFRIQVYRNRGILCA